MAYDLSDIRTKIRRLTKSPSVSQISDNTIDKYINDFYIYELPETLQFLKLKKVYSFYTEPNRDTYDLGAAGLNILNNYINFNPPVYFAGLQGNYYQDRELFYRRFPQIMNLQNIGTGDGATASYTGTITNTPILPGSITISANKTPLAFDGHTYDKLEAQDDGSGALTGDVTVAVYPASNYINYDTGEFKITFNSNVATDTNINLMYFPYAPSKPYTLLYYDSKFLLRPVPDQVYRVDVEGVLRPTALAVGNLEPELASWWEYISIGAARKILLDRLDMETLQMLEPEFRRQGILVNRRLLRQLATQRSSTIYVDSLVYGNNYFNNGWNY